ncbi:unnamed protein product [Moneuplotes crassus]|uniref:Uncharacterized protein n=1 Tax=Euplotes crassus TaxID=5936 RepID=A0AAD1XSV7_EUPCR|nr:unnamed protein product [Moneuplotes crassus]
MKKRENKRLIKGISAGQRCSPFKFPSKKGQNYKIKNLTHLIQERQRQLGKPFSSMIQESDEDYAIADIKIAKKKVPKSRKIKNKSVHELLGSVESNSELEEGLGARPNFDTNYAKKNTGRGRGKFKSKCRKKTAPKRKPPASRKRKAPPKKKGGGRKKKRTIKDFRDLEAESEGGSNDELEDSADDRYESDFICDDETAGILEEGTYEESEQEYFSKSEGSDNCSDWSQDSQERFENMEIAKNDGKEGRNMYRHCKDEDNYYLERRFRIHRDIFESL